MGRLIDCNDVYNTIQITTDNFGVLKRVVESNMLTMLSKIETVEAIPKDQYEARLKADMVAILEELQLEIEETVKEEELIDKTWANGLHYSEKIIQQKIDALKEKEFHCEAEESGWHAYNCNNCSNKCEEWHQWNKEINAGSLAH